MERSYEIMITIKKHSCCANPAYTPYENWYVLLGICHWQHISDIIVCQRFGPISYYWRRNICPTAVISLPYPTGSFTISEPRNQEIGEFYGVQERLVTDFKARKLWKGRSGTGWKVFSFPPVLPHCFLSMGRKFWLHLTTCVTAVTKLGSSSSSAASC